MHFFAITPPRSFLHSRWSFVGLLGACLASFPSFASETVSFHSCLPSTLLIMCHSLYKFGRHSARTHMEPPPLLFSLFINYFPLNHPAHAIHSVFSFACLASSLTVALSISIPFHSSFLPSSVAISLPSPRVPSSNNQIERDSAQSPRSLRTRWMVHSWAML